MGTASSPKAEALADGGGTRMGAGACMGIGALGGLGGRRLEEACQGMPEDEVALVGVSGRASTLCCEASEDFLWKDLSEASDGTRRPRERFSPSRMAMVVVVVVVGRGSSSGCGSGSGAESGSVG